MEIWSYLLLASLFHCMAPGTLLDKNILTLVRITHFKIMLPWHAKQRSLLTSPTFHSLKKHQTILDFNLSIYIMYLEKCPLNVSGFKVEELRSRFLKYTNPKKENLGISMCKYTTELGKKMRLKICIDFPILSIAFPVLQPTHWPI